MKIRKNSLVLSAAIRVNSAINGSNSKCPWHLSSTQ
jgi:hypothetical protein